MQGVLIPRYVTIFLGGHSSFLFRRLGRALRPGSGVGFPLWSWWRAPRSGPRSRPGPRSGDRRGLWLGSPGRSGLRGGARAGACARAGLGAAVARSAAGPRAAPASRSAAAASPRAKTKEEEEGKKRQNGTQAAQRSALQLRDRAGGTDPRGWENERSEGAIVQSEWPGAKAAGDSSTCFRGSLPAQKLPRKAKNSQAAAPCERSPSPSSSPCTHLRLRRP